MDRKINLLRSGLALLLIPFFFACDDPNQLGILVDGKDQNIHVRDTTFTLPISTILIDSLLANQNPNIIVGHSSGDSIFGELTAIGYTQYAPYSGTRPKDTLNFESAYIIFDIAETRSTGILPSEHWDIHEASDTLYRRAYYLADRSIPYDPTPIISFDFSMDPATDTILQIPFNDIGEKLFDQLVKAGQDSIFNDSLNFGLLHYPALVAVPSAGSQGIHSLNFSADTSALYIKMKSPTSNKIYYYKYNFLNRGHYTHIIRDRAGSKLASLNEEYIDEVDGRGYASMINGTYLKIDLEPYLQFISDHPGMIVNNSNISLTTIDYASTDYINPFINLRFLFIRGNKINGPGTLDESPDKFSSAILTDGSYQSASATQSLLTLSYVSEAPNYSGTTTLFTQIVSDAASNENRKEIVIINPASTSLKQSIFTGVKLRLYYTLLE